MNGVGAAEGLRIRPASADDILDLARVAAHAVQRTGPAHYTPQQVRAWAAAIDAASIAEAMQGGQAFVAEAGGGTAGFLVLRGDHIELLYVHPDHGRRGIAVALVRRAQYGRRRLTTEASSLSAPVFARCGFRDIGPSGRELLGVPFTNRIMHWP